MRRLKLRDPLALTDLYTQYEKLVFSTVRQVVRNQAEAEEIVQDVFLRIWTRAHLLDESCTSLVPWMMTVTRNMTIDYLRTACGKDRRFEHTTYNRVPSPVCSSFTSDFLQGSRIRFAVHSLPAHQQAVIQLAFFEGLSHSEISTRLGTPLGTVKTWVRKALETLQTALLQTIVPRAAQEFHRHSSAHAPERQAHSSAPWPALGTLHRFASPKAISISRNAH